MKPKGNKSPPIEFLKDAQQNAKTNAMVQAALEKGAEVTAAEVLKIAKSRGYKFTRKEFESAVRKSYVQRFATGDYSVAELLAPSRRRPPLSSCARGCLSYTYNWHPRVE